MPGVMVEILEAAYLTIRSSLPHQYLSPLHVKEDEEKEHHFVKTRAR